MLGRPGTFNLTGENMQAVLDLIDKLEILLEKIRITVEPRININVKPHVLKEAIAICKKAIPKRPTHAVLANFLLSAKHGRITLTATNLDTFIEVELDGEILEDGAICIPAFLIEKIIESAKDVPKNKSFYRVNLSQSITEHDQLVLNIAYKSSKQAIACMSADEFPATPEVVGDVHNIPNLVNNFKKLKPHCRKDMTYPTTQGVNIGNGKMIATDGQKVVAKAVASDIEVIIPSVTPLQVFSNPSFSFITGDDGRYGFIKFFENGITITQRMPEGRNFATDWEFTVPETVVAVISKWELSSIKRELEIFKLCAESDGLTNKEVFDMWLQFEDGKVTIKSHTELLENSYTLTNGVSVVDKLIYVDARKLISLLEAANQDIEICVDNEYGLIAIKQHDLLLGIMPLNRMKKEVVTARGCGYSPAVNIPYYVTSNSLVVTENRGQFKVAETLFSPYAIADDGTKYVIVDHSGFGQPETLTFPYERTKDGIGIVVTKNRAGFLIADDLPYIYSDNILTVVYLKSGTGFYPAERIWD